MVAASWIISITSAIKQVGALATLEARVFEPPAIVESIGVAGGAMLAINALGS